MTDNLSQGHLLQCNELKEETGSTEKTSLDQFSYKLSSDLSYRTIISTLICSTIPVALTITIVYINETMTLHFLKSGEDLKILGAYGLGGTITGVVSLAIFFSLNVGLTSIASQAYGAKNNRLVGLYFHRGLIINLLLFIPCACLFYWSDKICVIMNFDVETSFYIQQLLFISIPGLFAMVIFDTITAYLNACGNFGVPGIIQIVASVIFWAVSYWLIEKLGMAIKGAAIAWDIMNFIQMIAIIIYTKVGNPVPGSLFRPCKDSFRGLWKLFRYELWTGSMIYLEWIAYEIIFLFAGTLNTVQYTALTIANTNINMVYSIPYALEETVLTYTGNAVGEKNVEKAKKYLKAGIFCSFITMLCVEVLYLFLSDSFIKFYVDDSETVEETNKLIRGYLLQVPPDFIEMILASGLRALGKGKTGTILMLVSYYLIALPLSYLFCFILKLEGFGLILGTVIDAYILLSALVVIYCRIDWKKQVQIAAEEIEKEEKELVEEDQMSAYKKICDENSANIA